MMSKKHFVRMADAISEEMLRHSAMLYSQDGRNAGDAVATVARAFADMAKEENPRFDRQKFYDACGLDSEGRAK